MRTKLIEEEKIVEMELPNVRRTVCQPSRPVIVHEPVRTANRLERGKPYHGPCHGLCVA